MATVYKRDNSKFWQIAWFDHGGKRRVKSSKTTDHAAAVRIANKLDADSSLKREGVRDPRAEEMAKHAGATIKSHLDAFGSYQLSRSGQGHVADTRTKIETICTAGGFVALRDLEADSVNRFASELRTAGKSLRTVEAYVQAIKSFSKWAVKTGKLPFDPLATVSKPNPESDRRLTRRFISHEEFHWLDAITREADEAYGMTGIERALLYSTAIQTGLRSSELSALTRGKLQLNADPPFILGEARSAKNKKLARQYVQPELAAELKQHVARKVGGSKAFNMPARRDVATMFRADVANARRAWLETLPVGQKRIEAEAGDFLRVLDSEGETVDFHALRHTTASWLIQAGADVKTVQAIMRHADIKLTLQRYGHLFPGSESAAVARIRDAFTNPVRIAATGTDSRLPDADCQRKCQQSEGETVRFPCDSVRDSRGEEGTSDLAETKGKQRKNVLFSRGKPIASGSFQTCDRWMNSPVRCSLFTKSLFTKSLLVTVAAPVQHVPEVVRRGHANG